MTRRRIVFVSTMAGDPWGGSEELWARTALDLVAQGFFVSASVHEWIPLHKRVQNLIEGGIDVSVRPACYPVWKRAWRRVTSRRDTYLAAHLRELLDTKSPSLVVLSTGTALPPVELVELCANMRVPFVTIGQANQESWWPEDDHAERYRKALPSALRCYFVSKANRRLAMKQIGCELLNAEVVWNPFNVEFSASPPFPPFNEGEGLLLACVGRLHPPSKGQDILLEALAISPWTRRNWRLQLCGEGNMKGSIERMARRLGLSDQVVFAGHIATEDIWASNQALVMPSRFEGLPLTIVEALLCGRTVVATNVAGNSEVIDDEVTGFLASAPTVPALLEALEKLWVRRAEVEEIGKLAARRIRQKIPADPIQVFSQKIQQLVQ